MGFDVRSKANDFYFNRNSWRLLLELALAFGWEPEGTISVHKLERKVSEGEIELEDLYADLIEERGRGSYFTNDGFIVTSSDAAALLDALDRVLESREQDRVKDSIDFSVNEEEEFEPERLADMFSPNPTQLRIPAIFLHRLMSLCRDGAFSIN